MSLEFLNNVAVSRNDGVETMSRSVRDIAMGVGHAVITMYPNAHPPFGTAMIAEPYGDKKPYVEIFSEGSGTAKLIIGNDFAAKGFLSRAVNSYAGKAARSKHPSGRGRDQ